MSAYEELKKNKPLSLDTPAIEVKIVWHRHPGPQRALFSRGGWRLSCLCQCVLS
jgi:hypothetical protein